ncbi:MAG: hypothetical protein ACLQLG_10610 [Thermoguttaceae bacterium]
MNTDVIHDRGRGPEIVGTRITVYNLLPYFLEPDTTEALICQIYDSLAPQQVAAARAYVLNHFEAVMAEHHRIEARNAAGNPPEVAERLERTHAAFESFRQRLAERQRAEAGDSSQPPTENASADNGPLPTFREWLVSQEPPGVEAS